MVVHSHSAVVSIIAQIEFGQLTRMILFRLEKGSKQNENLITQLTTGMNIGQTILLFLSQLTKKNETNLIAATLVL